MLFSRAFFMCASTIAFAGIASAAPAAPARTFQAALIATQPIAYFRFTGQSGVAIAGPSQYQATGGATFDVGGPLAADPGAHSIVLDGTSGWITTTQRGGIASAATMLVWVNLAKTPQEANRIIYVAGESQAGDDFDVQFEPDNTLRFYTAAGSNLAYHVDPASVAHRWHMIVVSFSTGAQTRAIYWDGKLVAHDANGGSKSDKTTQFTIGNSTLFHDRWLPGSVAEAALWNVVLTPAQVSAIYAARTVGPGT